MFWEHLRLHLSQHVFWNVYKDAGCEKLPSVSRAVKKSLENDCSVLASESYHMLVVWEFPECPVSTTTPQSPRKPYLPYLCSCLRIFGHTDFLYHRRHPGFDRTMLQKWQVQSVVHRWWWWWWWGPLQDVSRKQLVLARGGVPHTQEGIWCFKFAEIQIFL